MARTLTSTARNLLRSFQSYRYDVLIEAPAINLYWSNAYEGPPGAHLWSHRYISLGRIEQSVTPGGGLAHAGELRVEVTEDDTTGSLKNIWQTTRRLEGVAITCKILLDGEAYADAIEIFRGRIDRGTGWRSDVGILIATSDDLLLNKQIPSTVVERDSHPLAPDESINKTIPIVYGDGSALNLIPLILVDLDIRSYTISEHDNRTVAGRMAMWPQGSSAAKTITTSGAVTPGPRGIIVASGITQQLFGLESATRTIAVNVAVTSAGAAIDNLSTTRALINTTTVESGGTDGLGQLGVNGTFSNPAGNNYLRINVLSHARADESTVTTSGRLRVRTVDAAGAVQLDGLFLSENFRHLTFLQNTKVELENFSLEQRHIVQALVEARNEGGVGVSTDQYVVGEIEIEHGYRPHSPLEPLFLPGTISSTFEGRQDNASGTYTGTASALIENPVAVMHATMADLGLSVDADAASAARAYRASWVFAGGIGAGWFQDRLDGRQLIDDMARQAGCYIIPAGSAGYKIVAISGDQTSKLLCDDSVVLMAEGTERGIPRSSLVVQLSDMDQVTNHLEVRYGWHAGLNRFAQTMRWTPAYAPVNHTLAVNSQTRYGDLAPILLDAYMIGGSATALLLTDFLSRQFWSQNIFCSLEMPLIGIELELGDFVTISSADLPTDDNNGLFEVVGITQDLDGGVIAITARKLAIIVYNYLAIRDQAGVIWYWWIDLAGELTRDSSPPAIAGLTARDITPATIPYWLEIDDTAGTTWYMYPETTTGEFAVASAQPTIGTGYDVGTGLAFISTDRVSRTIKVSTIQEIIIE